MQVTQRSVGREMAQLGRLRSGLPLAEFLRWLGDIADGRNLGTLPTGEVSELGPIPPCRLDSRSKSRRYNVTRIKAKSVLASSPVCPWVAGQGNQNCVRCSN